MAVLFLATKADATVCTLADWLQRCRIKTVAIESTRVLWVPLFQIIEQRGFDLCLVNAHHVKNVSGSKPTFPIASGCNTCIRCACCRLLSGGHSRSALCVPSCAVAVPFTSAAQV